MQTFNLTGISFMPTRYNHVCVMRVHLLADFIWLSAYLITAVRQFEWPLFFHRWFKNIIRLPYYTKFLLYSLLILQSVNTVYWFLFWIIAFISKILIAWLLRYNHVCVMRVLLLADFIWLSAYLITTVKQFEWSLFFHPCLRIL